MRLGGECTTRALRLIRFLPEAHRFAASSMSLASQRLYSRRECSFVLAHVDQAQGNRKARQRVMPRSRQSILLLDCANEYPRLAARLDVDGAWCFVFSFRNRIADCTRIR